MKLPWRCMKHPGGSVKRLFGESPKAMESMPCVPPTTLSPANRSAKASNAARTSGESKSSSWLTHWSYTSGPCSRSMYSSTQSVPTQPVASPDSMPRHHGVLPSATICSSSAARSSCVSGIA